MSEANGPSLATRFAVALVLAAACDQDVDRYPISPTGGTTAPGTLGSGAAPTPDAPGSGATELEGFVCLLADPRDLASCSATDLGGITVELTGVGSAVTGSDGTFALPFPSGTNLTWSISGANLIPSTMGFGTTALVYAVGAQTFYDLLNGNGVLAVPSQATILGVVEHGGSGLPNQVVAATPGGTFTTFYAAPDNVVWAGSATSGLGTFFVPGLTSSVEQLEIGAPGSAGSGELTSVFVPVGAGAVSFVDVAL